MATHKVHRYHDISCGHRVHGHEGKCRHLHGHNYRVHFTCVAEDGHLDNVGRVIDFSEVKEKLCMWLEKEWDHFFLIWEQDPMRSYLLDIDSTVVVVPFNPTAENLAEYLVEVVGPKQLAGTGIKLVEVKIEETMKCFASYGV